MGGVTSKLFKPIRTFNIENRAQKVMKKNPVPAPSYPSIEKQKQVADQINPNFMVNHYKKDSMLDDRLKKVFVSSHIQHDNSGSFTEKFMPQNRSSEREFDYGFWEPDITPESRARLRDILQLMSDYVCDMNKNNAKNIASKYKLNLGDVENLLEYYRVFKVIIPHEGRFNHIRVADTNIRSTIDEK